MKLKLAALGFLLLLPASAFAAPAFVEFSRQPNEKNMLGAPIALPLSVAVREERGNVAINANCVVTMSLVGGQGASLAGPASMPVVNGFADYLSGAFRVVANADQPLLRLRAGATCEVSECAQAPCAPLNLRPAYSNYFSATGVGEPFALQLKASPKLVRPGLLWPVINVAVVDLAGNTITQDNATVVTLRKDEGSGAGNLAGILSVMTVNGVATFNDVWIGERPEVSEAYFIRVESSGGGGPLRPAAFRTELLP